MDVRKYIKNNILLFDGAMGTMLQQRGLKIGENPEIFGFKNPDKLMEIHSLYLDAGSNVITTNTFGANELKLDKLGYTVEEIIDNAVNIAKKAIEKSDKSKPRFVALDVGPIGEMLEPIGKLSFDKVYEIFKKAEESTFLKGKNGRKWKANFDWIMKETNFVKILEGNYDECDYSGSTDSVYSDPLDGIYE